jgi:CheY-like chemotaxis protein
VIADNGRDAHRVAHIGLPDLILLDMMMPGESGFETCAHWKSDSATAVHSSHLSFLFE